MRTMLAHVCATPLAFKAMGSAEDGYLYDRFDLGGGRTVDFRMGRGAVVEELIREFPREEEGIRRYLDAVTRSGRATDAMMAEKFVPLWLPGRGAPMRRWLHRVVEGPSGRAWDTAADVVAEYVADPALRALLAGGQMIDYNLPPGQVSWLVSAGMHNYYKDGGWYPVGGSQTIPSAVIPIIERAGGRVLCRAPVARILTSGSAAAGVELQCGDVVSAPLVVSAAGFSNTFERLLSNDQLLPWRVGGGEGPAATLKKLGLGPSHSHMCAFVTLDAPPEELGLKPFNIQ
mmetsp:Transcript_33263/g.106074  ORF Transcript_33263/g.106074 Transcript_33263/m.106074 type:complete len:288 (+) Transcript_33263:289-1152(+)